MKNLFALTTLALSLPLWAWTGKDFKNELLSPTKHEAKYILLGGATLTTLAIIFEEEIDRGHNKVVNNKPLGDFSNYGDIAGQLVPNAAYVLANMYLGYRGDEEGHRRALGMFKATAYAGGVTTALKYVIREPRPHDHSQRNSFPSGHSSTVFAFSGYVWAEHGWKWGVPAMSVALLTGASRVNDNKHRVHDVLAGATIGLGFGFGIQRLQKNGPGQVSFAPIIDSQTKGLAAYLEY